MTIARRRWSDRRSPAPWRMTPPQHPRCARHRPRSSTRACAAIAMSWGSVVARALRSRRWARYWWPMPVVARTAMRSRGPQRGLLRNSIDATRDCGRSSARLTCRQILHRAQCNPRRADRDVPRPAGVPGVRVADENEKRRRTNVRRRISSEVPKGGLEPPRACTHCDLNAARLPVPPLRQHGENTDLGRSCQRLQQLRLLRVTCSRGMHASATCSRHYTATTVAAP